MFESIDEIYEHIGQSMYNALPEEWDIAYLDMIILEEGSCCGMQATYFINGEKKFYRVNTIDGEAVDSKCDDAFYALYKMMKRSDMDMPWNKARFELEPDGSFDLQFKFDEDLVWYTEVDPDSELYDSIDVSITRQIKTWEGLPEDMPRPWKDGQFNTSRKTRRGIEMADYQPSWEALGSIDDVLELTYMNPFLADYPQWHGSNREILLVKRADASDWVCTRGLSSSEEAFEVYLQTNEEVDPLNGSWQMNLIKTIGSIIPNISNFKERLSDHTFLTLQLDMDGAPEEWSVDHPDGNIGMFIGLLDTSVDYDALNFLPINVKLMRPDELLHCIEFGAKGRSELAELYQAQGMATLSSLSRESALNG